ncbi:MAG TPA: GNAT family N-acetyltransferase [Gaiellaceae bacterium]|nr:GNAT family N-acetyltransferase [Gaiellaceae bacterium]
MPDLTDFVEAPGRFMEPTEGALVVKTPRFVVQGGADGVWASVQGTRLRDGEAADAVAEVRELLTPAGSRVVSWWLTELSTPLDVEEQLLDAGLQLVADDYLIDGLLTTNPPPAGPPEIEVRLASSAEEWATIRELQDSVFDNPPERRPTREQLLAEFPGTNSVLFGAWLDGELVGAGAAAPSSRGLLLWGGSVRADARGRGCYRALVRARWEEAVRRGTPALTVGANEKSGPVLRKLGFEKVLQFRRLEDVLSVS